jgi:hypothetical protein
VLACPFANVADGTEATEVAFAEDLQVDGEVVDAKH